jgi:hypothetical protein
MEPAEALRAGASELKGILGLHEFVFSTGTEGKGSGGRFASGEFRRGDRRLDLHFRFALGLVTYHVGAHSLPHSEYVRAVRETTDAGGEPSYPGFSADPTEAFVHLADDLKRFGRIFLCGQDHEFLELAAWARGHPAPTGFAALP